MSFYTSLTGLKAAQNNLGTVSNNIANANTTGFKKSRTEFGDVFASGPLEDTSHTIGQGTRLAQVRQQFSQGTIEATNQTLDLAIAGGGMFVVKEPQPSGAVSYTRNGAFSLDSQNNVVDQTGSRVQILPVDAAGNTTASGLASTVDFVVPQFEAGNPNNLLSNLNINEDGLIIATFADGATQNVGKVAMADFPAMERLRPIGGAKWQATGQSGAAIVGTAGEGRFGNLSSGSLERANVDITEELVGLISAQRNFQANAKAIETASNVTQAIFAIT